MLGGSNNKFSNISNIRMVEMLFCTKCQTIYCVFFFASPHMHKKPQKNKTKTKKTKTNGKCYLNILFNDESKHKIIVETLDKCYRNGKTSVFVTYHCEKRIFKEERNR